MSRDRQLAFRLAILLGLGLGVVTGCAEVASGLRIATTAPSGGVEQIPAYLVKPEGPGPFPAVVIMHDCSGLGPRSSGAPDRWARQFVSRGYVVLMPDSFTTRGYPAGVCTDASPRRIDVSPLRRVLDAHAALAYLRTLPYVDGRRVGVMGGSHGGTTTLATVAEPERAPGRPDEARSGGFVAAVALYPSCASRLGQWNVTRQTGMRGPITEYAGVYTPNAPVLILIGESDDWTPAEPCQRLARTAREAGHPVEIKVYPGAHHSFDSPNPIRYVAARINPNSLTGRGATTGGNPTAWADSIREALAFFGRHLQ